MTLMQKFILAVAPGKWAEEMRAESEAWRVRCLTCGNSRSVWEAGGIRWKATSVGKQTRVWRPQCGGVQGAAVEQGE